MIFTFLVEIILVFTLWIILKKLLKKLNPYALLTICLSIALITGYFVAYRGVEFQVTQDYLEKINNQKIELIGQSITPEEENAYKERLFHTEEFKTNIIVSALKISLLPFLPIALIMLFFTFKKERGVKNFKSNPM